METIFLGSVHEGNGPIGTTGEVFAGQVPTVVPDVAYTYLLLLLQWADGIRTPDERRKALPVLRRLRARLDQIIEADERLAKPTRRK